jgi:hypothetical protein
MIVWTAADFEPLVGARFELVDPEHFGAGLWLESATEIGRSGFGGPSGRAPFSLIFRGQADGPDDQAVFRLRHQVAGEMTLLLVPVDRRDPEPRFEAVVG